MLRWGIASLWVMVACGAKQPPPAETADFDEPAWASRTSGPSLGDDQSRNDNRAERVQRQEHAASPHRFRSKARVDMDFRNADLTEVFRMLATVGGMNIVLAPNVTGAVTLRLKSVEWGLALETICRAHNLEVLVDRDVLLIRRRASR